MTNTYTLKHGKTIYDAATTISSYICKCDDMFYDRFETNNGGYIIQGRPLCSDKLYHIGSKLVGMDVGITVKLTPVDRNRVQIEVGKGKWIDKAVGTAVACALSPIILLGPVIGSANQLKLQARVNEAILDCFEVSV